MEEVSGYNITTHLLLLIIFVANQPEIEELYNLTPIIKNLRANADYLNAFFINFGNED